MALKCNMGKVDRGLRTVAGCVLLYLGFFSEGIITNTVVQYILGFLGVMNLLTAVIGFCPMYVPANFSTNSKSGS